MSWARRTRCPAPATANDKLAQFNRFNPRGDQATVDSDGETSASITFRLRTCPLLAATLWPLTYADVDATPADNALHCAVEDYGDETVAHSPHHVAQLGRCARTPSLRATRRAI